MLHRLSLLGALIFASAGHAEIIKCVFTEPFVTTVYNMHQSTLTYKGFDSRPTINKGVSFVIRSAGVFELVKDGQVYQTLTLNNKGSDGMSNTVYPYEVKDAGLDKMANNGFGGCSSSQLPTKEEEQKP